MIQLLCSHVWRSLRSLALGAILLVAVALPGVALAQGTGGSLPDPISSRELDQFMDRLKMDDAQRRATESLHESYLEDFKLLREGEIEKFMEATRSMQGNMPERAQLEEFLNDMNRLQTRIARLDDQLFDRVLPLLRDDQQIPLTRAKMFRARDRMGGDIAQMIGFLIPAAGIDLATMYERLRLSPDELLQIQSLVMEYESKQTKMRREIYDATTRLFLDAFTMMEEQGFSQETFEDPEQAQKAMEFLREAWATLSQKVMGLGMEVSNLNRRTCRRLTEMLPDDAAQELHAMYFQQAYPELPTSSLENDFKKALRYKDLTDEQWASLSVLQDEFRRQERNLYNNMADLHDTVRATKSPFDFGGMGRRDATPENDEITDKLAALAERHTKLVENTTNSINTLLDADLVAKIAAQPDPENDFGAAPGGSQVVTNADGEVVSVDGVEVSQTEFNQPSESANQPVSIGAFKQQLASVGLDEATQSVVEQLHGAYVARFTAARDDMQQKITEAQSQMWRFDEATSTTTGPTIDQVDKMHELRKANAQALREIDAQFFRDLALACGEDPERQEQIEMFRLIRERVSYGVESDSWGWGMYRQGSQAGRIDLVDLCFDERFIDEAGSSLKSVLAAYQVEITAAMKNRHEQGLHVQQVTERGNAEMYAANQAREDDGNFDMAAAMRYQEAVGKANEKLNAATAEVARINSDAIEKIKAALNPDDAARFEKAFKRRAYPSVYMDAEMLDRTFAKARSLGSLSETQKSRLEELLSSHEKEDDALREKMIAVLGGNSSSGMPADRDDWREYQRVQNSIDKLRFEREELLAKTRRRVQDLLSDDQLAQVGGPFAKQVSSAATVEGATAGP